MSDTNRPVTIRELSGFFGVSVPRVEQLLRRHHIEPAFRIGRLRLFGPKEARAIHNALGG